VAGRSPLKVRGLPKFRKDDSETRKTVGMRPHWSCVPVEKKKEHQHELQREIVKKLLTIYRFSNLKRLFERQLHFH
jgi:hypothetical protein